MKLIIRDKSTDVTEWAAKYVIKRINAFNPGPGKMFVLGLPTGGTPLGMYKALVKAHKDGKISFKYVITFNMDEYVGIPEDHPESYHRWSTQPKTIVKIFFFSDTCLITSSSILTLIQ